MACFKSYVFGDRFLSAGFCRAVTRHLNGLIQGNRLQYKLAGCAATSFALANIAADEVILQNLVDNYANHWKIDHDDFSVAAQNKLPKSFVRRVAETMRGGGKYESRCYLEHADDGEKASFSKDHMRYDAKNDVAIFE